jgi:hypothetical protein
MNKELKLINQGINTLRKTNKEPQNLDSATASKMFRRKAMIKMAKKY